MATKSILKKKRAAVYPTAGFVTFNWQRSSLGSAVYGTDKDKIYLTAEDKQKLNTAQLIGNRRGFVVALACPRCGSVVQTYRGNDLPDGYAAKCSSVDCTKVWLDAD